MTNVKAGPWGSKSDQGTPIVIDGEPPYDSKMSATTDKDYIDARLKAMSDSLDQRLETAAAKSDGRLEVIETRMDGRIAILDEKLHTGISAMDSKLVVGMANMDAKFDINFARIESLLHKAAAETHKTTTDSLTKVITIVSALFGVGIAVIVFVVNNGVQKPAPAASTPGPVATQQAASTPAPPQTPMVKP